MIYKVPGVYIEETQGGTRPIQPAGTSTAGFVGIAPNRAAEPGRPVAINNWSQFTDRFYPKRKNAAGEPTTEPDRVEATPLAAAVFGFFANQGRRCFVVNLGDDVPLDDGLRALATVGEISLVAAPGYCSSGDYDSLIRHCRDARFRFALLDGPGTDVEMPYLSGKADKAAWKKPDSDEGIAALYWPWIEMRDPLRPKVAIRVPPTGHVAGIYGRTDATRGVHKAPANATVATALDVCYPLIDQEQEQLNPNGINCIRAFTGRGIRVWGARTVAGGESPWRYINVRRVFQFVARSIAESTHWIVFEPNNHELWHAISRDVTAFLTMLWRQGMLFGTTPDQAFYVKCDEETNPPESRDLGIVVTEIGLAVVKPAEFIVFRLGQYEGGTTVEATA